MTGADGAWDPRSEGKAVPRRGKETLMRRDFKPEFPDCGTQRPNHARRSDSARRSRGRFAVLGLLLISLMLLLVPGAQAHSAEQEARVEARRSSKAAERAAEKQARSEAIAERKEWPKEANAEWEHGSVQVTCTQIKWDFTGFAAGSTSVLEKVSVDHSQAYLTVSSFDGVTDYVTTNIMETPAGTRYGHTPSGARARRRGTSCCTPGSPVRPIPRSRLKTSTRSPGPRAPTRPRPDGPARADRRLRGPREEHRERPDELRELHRPAL